MAEEKRKVTGDERYYATMEMISMPFSRRVEAIIGRPFKILFQEPILIAVTAYMSVRSIYVPCYELISSPTIYCLVRLRLLIFIF